MTKSTKPAKAKASGYGEFLTNESLEKTGIIIEYEAFRVTIARAGGANKKYNKVSEAKTKPLRRAIQTETISNERAEAVLREVYVEAVILNWEVKNADGEWEQGIENMDRDVVPFDKKVVLAVLTGVPELWRDLKEQAEKVSLFRETLLEDEGKN